MQLFEKITEYRSALANIEVEKNNEKFFAESIKVLSEQKAKQELQAKRASRNRIAAEKKTLWIEQSLNKDINIKLDELKSISKTCDELEIKWFSDDESQKELMETFSKESEMFDELIKVQQFFKIDFDLNKKTRNFISKPRVVNISETLPTNSENNESKWN